MTTDNRTNEQIVAEALSEVVLAGYRVLNDSQRSSCAYLAVTALASAGRLVTAQGAAPVPSSGVDEDALAEVIASVTDLWDDPLDEVHDIPQIARAVAEWLQGQER